MLHLNQVTGSIRAALLERQAEDERIAELQRAARRRLERNGRMAHI
jgi:hypothetical protein